MFDYVSEVTNDLTPASVFLRLLIATVAGVVIGLERESKNKGAGVKTHVLVCIGSALTMIVGEYTYLKIGAGDPTRIGSSVVSGVGFLGVGTIMVGGIGEVKGLTTAAGLWACACLGLCAGIGYIEGVLIASLFILFTLIVLRYADKFMANTATIFELYVEIDQNHNVKHFLHELRRREVSFSNVHIQKGPAGGDDGPIVTLSCHSSHLGEKKEILEAVNDLPYVRHVEDV